MVIVLLGPPGCGKGTISSFLFEKYNFKHVSAGELIRNEINKGGNLARKINEIILEGKLVSDDIINELLKKKILKHLADKDNVILDGYPRNIEQAKYLESIAKVDYALNIDVDIKVIKKRILGRRTCQKCGNIYNIYYKPPKKENICDIDNSILTQRIDDNEETIEKRINVFNENNKFLLDFYKNQKILENIKNNDDIVDTQNQIKKVLNLK